MGIAVIRGVGPLFGGTKKPPSTLLNSLVAYWPMSEDSGNRADLGPSGYTLSAVGATPPGSATGLLYPKAASFVRAADDDWLSSAAAGLKSWHVGGSFTIAAWVYLTAWASGSPFYSWILINGGPWSGGIQFFLSSDTSVLGVFTSNNVAAFPHSVAGLSGLNAWNLIQGWWDNNAQTAYANINNGTAGSDHQVITPTAAPYDFHVGGDNNIAAGKSWDGQIGPIMLWNRLLTPTEWTSLYNAGAGVAYPF